MSKRSILLQEIEKYQQNMAKHAENVWKYNQGVQETGAKNQKVVDAYNEFVAQRNLGNPEDTQAMRTVAGSKMPWGNLMGSTMGALTSMPLDVTPGSDGYLRGIANDKGDKIYVQRNLKGEFTGNSYYTPRLDKEPLSKEESLAKLGVRPTEEPEVQATPQPQEQPQSGEVNMAALAAAAGRGPWGKGILQNAPAISPGDQIITDTPPEDAAQKAFEDAKAGNKPLSLKERQAAWDRDRELIESGALRYREIGNIATLDPATGKYREEATPGMYIGVMMPPAAPDYGIAPQAPKQPSFSRRDEQALVNPIVTDQAAINLAQARNQVPNVELVNQRSMNNAADKEAIYKEAGVLARVLAGRL